MKNTKRTGGNDENRNEGVEYEAMAVENNREGAWRGKGGERARLGETAPFVGR